MKIAYLAPEIPALSATFVYEEMLALEGRGFSIESFSVRRPANIAKGQLALESKTHYLYEPGYFKNLFGGLSSLLVAGSGSFKMLWWLMSDMFESGIFRGASWKLLYQFLVAARLASFLKLLNCEHLHVHFAHVPAQIGMYAAAMAGVPFTVMAHANDIFERALLLKEKAERSKKFLTISEFNHAYLEGLGLPPQKLAVVRCGVSFDMRAKPAPLPGKEVYRIGTLGRLVEKKGVDVLIRALAALKGKPYTLMLSIAGDGPLRQELEQLVGKLGLQNHVVFEGALSHGQVAEWMQSLDAFVLACKKDANGDMDGIPVVLMEAMSQSIPVISTWLSGIPELVIDQQTGLLAEPGDMKDLAVKLDMLITSPGLAERLTYGARNHVATEFGQQVNLDRLVKYFVDQSVVWND